MQSLPEENPEKRALLDAWHIIRSHQQIVHEADAWHQLESTLYYLDQRLRGYFEFDYLEPQSEMEPEAPMKDNSLIARSFNKYGEEVTSFHGPVCSVCKQRIGTYVDYHVTQKNENLCNHCHAKLVPNV